MLFRINMDDAKEIHSSLKKAAGIFKEFKVLYNKYYYVTSPLQLFFILFQDNHVGRLSNPPDKCSDMDPSVLQCYVMCCQAEAQEG